MIAVLSRFCPGCVGKKLRMDEAPCPLCGRVNAVSGTPRREGLHPLAQLTQRMLLPLGGWAHAWTLLFCAFSLWSLALREVLPFLGMVGVGLMFSGLIAGGIWLLRLGVRAAVWVLVPATRAHRRPGGRSFAFLPGCLAIVWVLGRLDVPLRVAFAASRPGLEAVASAQINAYPLGTPPSGTPLRRAGFYRVKRTDAAKGSVRIEVTDNEFLSGTRAGFARCPQGCEATLPPIYSQNPAKPIYTPLGGGWYWWEQFVDEF